MEGVLTEPVDIDGAQADVVRPVALRLPPGANVEQPVVTVRVSIAPTRSFSVSPQLSSLASGLTAAVAPAAVQVVLSGALPDLGAVGAGDIEASIDLGGLEAGDHVVAVQVTPPPGTTLVFPIEVRVTIRSS